MKATTALASAVLAIVPSLTHAQLTNWAVNAGGNGHYYEAIRVPGGITWSNASLIASNQGGYLATITSSKENAFVFGLVSQDTSFWYHSPANTWWGPWLGGVQPGGSPEPAGGWQWITGEPFTYSNWSSGQPNNSNGNENRVQLGGQTSIIGTWNDLSETNTVYVRSFVIEYNSNPLAPSLSIIYPSQGQVWVQWQSRTDLTYTVEWTSNPASGVWASLTNIAGNGARVAVPDAAAREAKFYRAYSHP